MRASARQDLLHGFVAGVVGYLAVALFFASLNLVGGRSPFHTPAALGAALFGAGAPTPSGATGWILAFNGLHLAVSLVAGLLAGWLLHETQLHHAMGYLAFFALLAASLETVVVLGVVGVERLGVLDWWAAITGTAVAALAMGLYLLLTHRALARALLVESKL